MIRISFQKKPYQGAYEMSKLKNIQNNKQNLFKNSENKHLDDMIRKLLKEKVDERLNLDDYFNHPFFQKVDILLVYKTKGKIRLKFFEINL